MPPLNIVNQNQVNFPLYPPNSNKFLIQVLVQSLTNDQQTLPALNYIIILI
jgi:hypothetical protein